MDKRHSPLGATPQTYSYSCSRRSCASKPTSFPALLLALNLRKLGGVTTRSSGCPGGGQVHAARGAGHVLAHIPEIPESIEFCKALGTADHSGNRFCRPLKAPLSLAHLALNALGLQVLPQEPSNPTHLVALDALVEPSQVPACGLVLWIWEAMTLKGCLR